MKQSKIYEYLKEEAKKPIYVEIELNSPKTKIFINRFMTAWGIVEEKVIKIQSIVKPM